VRLAAHRLLGGAPRDELAWLASNGSLRTYGVGDVTTRKGQPEVWLQIVLSGHLAIHTDRGAGSRRIIGWRGGDVCGLMPYSRGGAPPGDTVAEEPTETLAVERDRFSEMIRECPRVTAVLVHAMLDRARHFTSSDLHDEKLVSLGKLAAGLAHELNNPASAAARSAKLLAASLVELNTATRALEAARLSDEQLATLDEVRALCASGDAARGAHQSPLERVDREEALSSWLDSHRMSDSLAAPLSETELTVAALDSLSGVLHGHLLAAAVQSIAAGRAVRALATDIEASTTRIHDLVGAVKGFTYMDRAPTPEPVDIRRGITDTLMILGAKARSKAVTIEVTLEEDLPSVRGFGGELNQVWSNLIDNALDAVNSAGRIEVRASRDRDCVVVRVIDDGAGIPREIQDKVFDPFFTTKNVGAGTGLGLGIVRRLMQRHEGEVEFESRSGRTEFRVSLPIA
jgi:signal transduction histidine kinase